LVSGTNIKTVNGTSVLGSGNIAISAGMTNAVYDLTGNITLAANVNRNIVINSATAEYNITLPDATQVAANGGVMFNFVNRSNFIIRVLDANGVLLFPVQPSSTAIIACTNTSSASGVWSSLNGVVFGRVTNTTTFLFTGAVYEYGSAICEVDTGKFIVVYNSGSAKMAVVVSVSPSGVVTTGTVFSTGVSANQIEMCKVAQNKVALVYVTTSLYVNILTINNLTITQSVNNLGIAAPDFATVCPLSTDKFIISTSSTNQRLHLITVSGTTLSLASSIQLMTGTVQIRGTTVARISDTKVLAMYLDSGTFIRSFKIITISGTNLSAGAADLYSATHLDGSPSAISGGYSSGKYAVSVTSMHTSLTGDRMGGIYFTFFDTSTTAVRKVGSIRLNDLAAAASGVAHFNDIRAEKISDSVCLVVATADYQTRMYLIDVASQEILSVRGGNGAYINTSPNAKIAFNSDGMGVKLFSLFNSSAQHSLNLEVFKGFE
jgi:hypothetical protein